MFTVNLECPRNAALSVNEGTDPSVLRLQVGVQRPTVRLGESGDDVLELQQKMAAMSIYQGPLNGQFDNSTESAVKAFQAKDALVADGIVGGLTWAALGLGVPRA